MLSYASVKFIHVTCAILSGTGFALRGWWMLRGSPLLTHPLTRILPHIVDTCLLAAALTLMVMSAQYPASHPWVAMKIVALIAYVVIGSIALKRGRTRNIRMAALAVSLGIFGYIAAVALTRQPFIVFG